MLNPPITQLKDDDKVIHPVNYWGSREVKLFNLGAVVGSEVFTPMKPHFNEFYWMSLLTVQRTKSDEIPFTDCRDTM